MIETKVVSKTKTPFRSFPTGWFSVGLSHELVAGKVIAKKIFDQEVVIFRTSSGIPSVIDAYCTHMGAHLGYGGRVEGESIRCPFHGFCFNANGNCVGISGGMKPSDKLSIKKWSLCEAFGLIFVWYDENQGIPTWEISKINLEEWPFFRSQSWKVRIQAHETNENVVDIGHFDSLHNFDNLEILEKATPHDHILRMRYATTRRGLFNQPLKSELDIHLYGLGCSLTNLTFDQYGLHFRILALTTPIDKEHTNLTYMTSINWISFQKKYPLLKYLPGKLLSKLILKVFMKEMGKTLGEDIEIWENKKYMDSPFLLSSESQIGIYRKWMKQFYKNSEIKNFKTF